MGKGTGISSEITYTVLRASVNHALGLAIY